MIIIFHRLLNFLDSIYISFLNSKFKTFTTLIYLPCLFIFSFILTQPLRILKLDNNQLLIISEIITFVLFLVLIPKWFRSRWGIRKTWKLIGLKIKSKKGSPIMNLFKGFSYSFLLITLLILPILINGWYEWQGKISVFIILNALLISFIYGLGEEILFRGWLQEELKFLFGLKLAVIIQALIFSLVHGIYSLELSLGLFILGILLSIRRLNDDGSIWGSVGLHGGLVGLWFIVNNIIVINGNSPSWLIGMDKTNINPIGGFYNIVLMILLIINFSTYNFQTLNHKK